jgi:hypothetical protein
VQCFPFKVYPLLKWLLSIDIDPLQKFAAIEFSRLAQPFDTLWTAGLFCMVVGGAGAEQFLEANYINLGGSAIKSIPSPN